MPREVEDPNEVIRRRRKVGVRSASTNEAELQNGIQGIQESGETVEPQSGKAETPQSAFQVPHESGRAGEPQNGKAGEQYQVKARELQNIEAGERESGRTSQPYNLGVAKQQDIKTLQPQSGFQVEQESGIRGERESGRAGEPQSGRAGERESGEAELNDQKITLYLSWRLLDKLDTMVSAYRRHTRKRIDSNKLMRMMIEQANLDDFLPGVNE